MRVKLKSLGEDFCETGPPALAEKKLPIYDRAVGWAKCQQWIWATAILSERSFLGA
jgi:hypothetical protein